MLMWGSMIREITFLPEEVVIEGVYREEGVTIRLARDESVLEVTNSHGMKLNMTTAIKVAARILEKCDTGWRLKIAEHLEKGV